MVEVKHSFEPVGEDCGTIYDESKVCSFCGVGWQQTSDLFLDTKKLPKRANLAFAQSIVPEIIVSADFVEVFCANHMKGASFRPVRDKRKPHAAATEWFQPVIHSNRLEILSPTKTGINFFDDDSNGSYRCPLGHTIGLQLRSELWVAKTDFGNSDIAYTKQYVGIRGGVIRPEQLLVISPRLWQALRERGLKGFSVEIVHLV